MKGIDIQKILRLDFDAGESASAKKMMEQRMEIRNSRPSELQMRQNAGKNGSTENKE